MTMLLSLIDAAPDPVGIGIVAIVVLSVIGVVILAVAGLVLFLWLRKRSQRHENMSSPIDLRKQSDVRR